MAGSIPGCQCLQRVNYKHANMTPAAMINAPVMGRPAARPMFIKLLLEVVVLVDIGRAEAADCGRLVLGWTGGRFQNFGKDDVGHIIEAVGICWTDINAEVVEVVDDVVALTWAPEV